MSTEEIDCCIVLYCFGASGGPIVFVRFFAQKQWGDGATDSQTKTRGEGKPSGPRHTSRYKYEYKKLLRGLAPPSVSVQMIFLKTIGGHLRSVLVQQVDLNR